MRLWIKVLIYHVMATLTLPGLAQQWSWQHPQPSGLAANDVFFIDPPTGWMVGECGSILRTDDGGATWTPQVSGLTAERLKAVVFVNENEGWAVGGNEYETAYVILHTVNGGMSWELQGTGLSILNDVAFIDSMHGWTVGGNGLILQTLDGGLHWDTQNSETEDALCGVTFLDDSTGWAVGGNYEPRLPGTIRHTTNGGATWDPQTTTVTSVQFNDVTFVDPQNGWIVGGRFGVPNGPILRTTDGGETWTMRTGAQDAWLKSLTFLDDQHGWAVGEFGTIAYTSDAGQSWQSFECAGRPSFEAIAFADPMNGIIVGGGYYQCAIARTSDGGATWQAIPDRELLPYEHALLHGVAVVDPLHIIAVGELGVAAQSTDGGLSWDFRFASPQLPDLQAITMVDDHNGWAVGGFVPSGEGCVLRTYDGGGNWTVQMGPVQLWNRFVIGVAAVDTQIAWAVGGNPDFAGIIWRTGDGGANWTELTTDALILCGVAFPNPADGWAVGANGTILHTTDGGLVWNPQYSGTAATFYDVCFVDADHGWAAGTDGVILHTTNRGARWDQQTTDTDRDFFGIAFRDADHGWAVGSEGMALATTDGGQTWRPHPSGSCHPLTDIAYDPGGRHVWAVGWSASVLRRSEPEASEPQPLRSFPESFSLSVSPNPFNARSLIHVSVPGNRHLHIAVYDLTGRLVAVLADRWFTSGIHSLKFDGASWPGGVYFAAVQSDGNRAVAKMVLLK